MSSHEARINDALKQLGEEFRLGMVAVEEYRARRRRLFETWGERDVTTSPGSMKSLPATAQLPVTRPNQSKAASQAPPPAARPGGLLLVAAIAVAGLLLTVVGYFVFFHHPAGPEATAAAAPAVAPASPEVLAIKRAADEFLARNAWDPEPIAAFLQQWQPLSPDDRARALQEPSLRTLRYELDQNLQAESQLVAADAPPEQRRRLDALKGFAQELGN